MWSNYMKGEITSGGENQYFCYRNVLLLLFLEESPNRYASKSTDMFKRCLSAELKGNVLKVLKRKYKSKVKQLHGQGNSGCCISCVFKLLVTAVHIRRRQ